MGNKIGVWLEYGSYVFSASLYKTRRENLEEVKRMWRERFAKHNKVLPKSINEFIENGGTIEFYEPEPTS